MDFTEEGPKSVLQEHGNESSVKNLLNISQVNFKENSVA
jgi:hypothetical protein